MFGASLSGNNTILIRLFPKYLFEFGMGMVFAELYCTGKLIKQYKNYVYLIVGIIGIALLGVSSKSALGRLLNDIPAFIGFLSFFFWMYKGNIQWMKYITIKISKCSFELYLLHMAILDVVFYYIHGSIISEMVAGLVSIVVAYVFAWGYSKLLLKCGLK